jgi:hypothetical protein
MKRRTLQLILTVAAVLCGQLGASAQYSQQYNYYGGQQGSKNYDPQNPTGVIIPNGNGRTLNGQNPYLNQPGYGYYNGNPYATGYPAYQGYGGGVGYGGVNYGVPVQRAGGYFQFGNVRGGAYWKSPSGHYYPWGGVSYGAPSPIIIVQQGESKPAQPPVSDMFKDIRAYLDEQNTKGKFLAEDYAHLSRRLRDIQQKESFLANRNNGSLELDSVDEDNIRKDLSQLSGDVARRVKP